MNVFIYFVGAVICWYIFFVATKKNDTPLKKKHVPRSYIPIPNIEYHG